MIGTTPAMSAHIKNLAVILEEAASKYGMHIALTGGQLYKDGHRKDVDFLLYHASNSSQNEAAVINFFRQLHKEGFSNILNFGRVTKMLYEGDSIDVLYPEFKRAQCPGDYWSDIHPDDLDAYEDLRRHYAIFNPEDLDKPVTPPPLQTIPPAAPVPVVFPPTGLTEL